METYQFTLRFDDDLHSLNQYNGLTAQQVGELLTVLSQAMHLNSEQKLILSDIKGNCYALELTTDSISVHENLKVVHRKISENDYSGLGSNEKKYANCLKAIIGNKLNLRAYDKDKAYYVKLDKIELPKEPTHYFEHSVVHGIITSIGGASLDGKAFIKINEENYQIEINVAQEKSLVRYYKAKKIDFSIKKKIDFTSDKIVSAELIDFEVLEEKTFIELVNEAKASYPDGLLIAKI